MKAKKKVSFLSLRSTIAINDAPGVHGSLSTVNFESSPAIHQSRNTLLSREDSSETRGQCERELPSYSRFADMVHARQKLLSPMLLLPFSGSPVRVRFELVSFSLFSFHHLLITIANGREKKNETKKTLLVLHGCAIINYNFLPPPPGSLFNRSQGGTSKHHWK